MLVGYLSQMDPTSRWSWSGGMENMFRALGGPGVEIVHIGRSLLPLSATLPWPLDRVAARLGSRNHSDKNPNSGKSIARAFAREIDACRPDKLFAPLSSFAFLETDLPIAYTSDITFKLWSDSYGSTSSQTPETRRYLDYSERTRIERADLLIYPSEWAARSAISDYQADPAKVRVIPFGAGVHDPPSDEECEQLLERRRDARGECRLLFVGFEWARKGGDIAVATTLVLNEMGLKARLTVVGDTPQLRAGADVVELVGTIDKSTDHGRKEFRRHFERAHFLIVPSRAEAYGFVFCEAAAYGVPVLATEVGGIPSIVKNGETGHLFALEAGGNDFAARARELLSDWEAYERMARAARRRFVDTLNWQAWGASVRGELSGLARRKT